MIGQKAWSNCLILALVVGGLIALSISVARGADRVPGEWMDDNQGYGAVIDVTDLQADFSGFSIPATSPGYFMPGTADDELLAFTRSRSTAIDLDALLSRCLEFLRDGDVDQSVSVQYSVYRPRTLKGDARDAIEEAQEALARIEKETQLRHDIEKALAALRGEK